MDSRNWFVETTEEKRRLNQVAALSVEFARRAPLHDLDSSFPHENIEDLRSLGYVHWTAPSEFGGEEIPLYEMLLHQEQIARGDGSTALAMGWHMGMMINLRVTRPFPEEVYREICETCVNEGALINSCASEPATGSPSRGGKPETKAVKVDGGYRITGRKTFSTLCPELYWIVVTATIEGTDEVGEFLIRGSEVRIDETWNMLGMRATGSHDIILDDVFVAAKYRLGESAAGNAKRRNDDGGGWMLHVPACYLGIALAARDFAVHYAANYQPNSLPHPISEVAHIQDKIGQMELKLMTARTFMYDLAKRWDKADITERAGMRPLFGAAKTLATNSALEVVDLAMRVVGARSMSKELPLERLYRDVRAGLHNPPMDDVTYRNLSKAAVAECGSSPKQD